jgi:hypothetical protein
VRVLVSSSAASDCEHPLAFEAVDLWGHSLMVEPLEGGVSSFLLTLASKEIDRVNCYELKTLYLTQSDAILI